MRRLKPKECHLYIDRKQYFIGVVLDISRKATVVKERGSIISLCVVLERLAIAQYHC